MNYFSRIPSKYFGFLSHFVLRKKPTLFGKLAWLPLISHILALHYGLKIIILAILSIYIANEFVELQTDGNPPFGSFFLICVIAIIATGFEFERLNKTVTYSPIFASFHWPKILAATYFVVSVIMLWYFNSKFFWNIQMGVFYSIITPIADTFFDASPKEHIFKKYFYHNKNCYTYNYISYYTTIKKPLRQTQNIVIFTNIFIT